MTKKEIIKEIKRLEKKQLRSFEAMTKDIKFMKDERARTILKETETYNLMKQYYNFNINRGYFSTIYTSKKSKSELEKILDNLQALELNPHATAGGMKKHIKEELKNLGGEPGDDLFLPVDWEQWAGYYNFSSEFVNNLRWASDEEQIELMRSECADQEPVDERQMPEEFASVNIKTIEDVKFILKATGWYD